MARSGRLPVHDGATDDTTTRTPRGVTVTDTTSSTGDTWSRIEDHAVTARADHDARAAHAAQLAADRAQNAADIARWRDSAARLDVQADQLAVQAEKLRADAKFLRDTADITEADDRMVEIARRYLPEGA